jgi:TetR/AcrR family transcriptional regulator
MQQRHPNRKQQILQALAAMLESNAGDKITTAKLAAELEVSEAALYRHFPSKARMYESLLDFVEETIFSRVTAVLNDVQDPLERCYQILLLVIIFCERNPGISRILNGDALLGENPRLRARVNQIFERIETQLRQCLRLAETEQGWRTSIPLKTAANLMLATTEGKIAQFVRSDFDSNPSETWSEQWSLLVSSIKKPVPGASGV